MIDDPSIGYTVTALAGVLVGLGVARAFTRGPVALTPTVTDTTPPTAAEVGPGLGIDLTAYVEDDGQDDDDVWSTLDTVVLVPQPRRSAPAGAPVGYDALAQPGERWKYVPSPGDAVVVRDRDGVLAFGRVAQVREPADPTAAFAVRYDTPTPETNHTDNHEENPMQYEPLILHSDESEQEFSGGVTLRIPAAWHVVAGEYANEGTPDLLVTVVHAIDGDGKDVRQEVAATIRDALAVTEEPATPPQPAVAPMLVVVTPSQEAADAFLDEHDTHHLVKNAPVRIVTPASVDQTLHGLMLGPLDHVVFVPGWEVAFISASNPNEESAWHRLTIALSSTFNSVPTWRAQIVQVP